MRTGTVRAHLALALSLAVAVVAGLLLPGGSARAATVTATFADWRVGGQRLGVGVTGQVGTLDAAVMDVIQNGATFVGCNGGTTSLDGPPVPGSVLNLGIGFARGINMGSSVANILAFGSQMTVGCSGASCVFAINEGNTSHRWPIVPPTAGQILTAGPVVATVSQMSWTGAVNVFTQNASAQSIPNTNTPTTITNWTDVTSNAAWNPTTGVFTAPVAGFYEFAATITWAATLQALGATFTLSVLQQATTDAATVWSQPVLGLAQVHSQTVTVGITLALNDAVSIQATLANGTGANALTAVANQNTLSITQLH